jgi:hypothetical protein
VAFALLSPGTMRADASIHARPVGEKAWEDLLTALADELVKFCSERQGNLSMVRPVAQARIIALDLRIVAGLYGMVEPERVELLLESAHALLEQGRLSQSGERERVAIGDEDDERMDVTLPGIPAAVFRKYLAVSRR